MGRTGRIISGPAARRIILICHRNRLADDRHRSVAQRARSRGRCGPITAPRPKRRSGDRPPGRSLGTARIGGFEPLVTKQIVCSGRYQAKRRELNPRPADDESAALPLSYFPRFEVPPLPDTRRAMVSLSAPDRHSEPVPLCGGGAASNWLRKKRNPGRRTADRGSLCSRSKGCLAPTLRAESRGVYVGSTTDAQPRGAGERRSAMDEKWGLRSFWFIGRRIIARK